MTNGLDRLQLDTLAITHIAPDAALATALPAGSITSLLVDVRQRLWLSTLGGGIAIRDSARGDAQPRFQRLTRAQGLPNDNVNKLLAFGDGEVWASTDDGLAVVDVESLTLRALRRAHGVAIPAYWGASGAATAAGEMLFGGGVSTVRRELVGGSYRGEIVVGGRLGILVEEWDETGGLDTTKANEWLSAQQPPLHMLGHIKAAKLYGGLEVETTLDPNEQPFLYDHAMDGTPLLPGVMGTEAFGQLALALAPGYRVAAVSFWMRRSRPSSA